MKKAVIALLIPLAAAALVSCSGSGGASDNADAGERDFDTLFDTVCSADEALELSRKTNAVVIERQGCTSGGDVWASFYRTVTGGTPASVLCAHYYVLDKEHMSEELYEEEKDLYPKLFFYLIEYDGKEYSVKVRESSEQEPDYRETFRYLLHFNGKAPSTALYDAYDNYVLADDPSATWDGIMAGLLSSQSDAGIKHCTVYRDHSGWTGG